MKNLVKVLNILPDDRFSGPIKRVVDVAALLNHQFGIVTTVCFPKGTGNGPEIAQAKSISAIRVPYAKVPHPSEVVRLVKWLSHLPRDVRSFCRVIDQTAPDLVHINGAFFLSPALAAKIMRKPLLWHLNDTVAGPILSRVLGILVGLLSSRIAAAAGAVGRYYGLRSSKFDVLYAPVDLKMFKPGGRSHTGVPGANVSMIANWNQVKRLDFFVNVVAEVKKTHPEVTFHLAGAKLDTQREYAEMVEVLIDRLQVGSKIIRYGFVDNVPEFLEGMDLHILTSRSEACPMTVLEGMAAGLPVVATDVGGVRELLAPDQTDKAGMVVPVYDYQAMAQAIIYLIEHPDEAKIMGQNGRHRADNLFSLNHCAQRHWQIYTGLLKDKPSQNQRNGLDNS